MRLRNTLLLLGCLMLQGLGQPASAYATDNLQLLPGAWSSARISGSSTFRFLGLQVYQATLWVSPGFDGAQYARHPFALELAYLRPFSGAAIARRSIAEMQRLEPLELGQARSWQQSMAGLFGDVQPGDRLTGVNRPGVGVSFLRNGQLQGTISDPHFAQLFFGIWLSPSSSEPALRKALLGSAAT
jgi:hypothetical protein